MRRTPLERRTELARGAGPKRRTPLVRKSRPKRAGAISPASDEQRARVRAAGCIVCDRDELYDGVRIDPAHVWPRGMGGCDAPLCVVPLCRDHHRAYDDGKLSLLEYMEPTYRAELAHAVQHAGLLSTLHHVTGERWVPAP